MGISKRRRELAGGTAIHNSRRSFARSDRAIARNPGQTRIEILVDHGGTLGDPSDDEFLEFLGVVKEATGRNDEFCELAVPMLVA